MDDWQPRQIIVPKFKSFNGNEICKAQRLVERRTLK